jgi:hypothetical protein
VVKRPEPLLNAHARQRIFELRSAVATHPIGSAVNGEHAAQVAVVATKQAWFPSVPRAPCNLNSRTMPAGNTS